MMEGSQYSLIYNNMGKNKKIIILSGLAVLLPTAAKAHCPLCTAGAGVLALGAAYIGVSTYVVGVFIGAFAMALSLWIPRLVKKQYIEYQKSILGVLIFLSTILPLVPMLDHYASFNIYWFGEYGSIFNKTYMINRFIIGSVVGALIMFLSPYISIKISRARKGKLFPYQGMAITFIMLAIASLFFQFSL